MYQILRRISYGEKTKNEEYEREYIHMYMKTNASVRTVR